MTSEFVIDVFGTQFDGLSAAGLVYFPFFVTIAVLVFVAKWIA